MTTGTYAYGVLRAADLEIPPALGIDDGDLRVEMENDLAAVVSDVEVDQFEGEALRRNASHPDWLEAKVRAHERVLDELVRAGAVIPMRFGSIFSRLDVLHDMLRDNRPELTAALDHVTGKNEWGVKVHLDAARLVSDAAPSQSDGSGRDYLMRKRSEMHAVERARETARDLTDKVHGELSRLANESRIMPTRERSGNVVLNAAYLVDDTVRDAFMDAAGALETSEGGGFVLEVTGPWPPYNFTSVDVSGTVS